MGIPPRPSSFLQCEQMHGNTFLSIVISSMWTKHRNTSLFIFLSTMRSKAWEHLLVHCPFFNVNKSMRTPPRPSFPQCEQKHGNTSSSIVLSSMWTKAWEHLLVHRPFLNVNKSMGAPPHPSYFPQPGQTHVNTSLIHRPPLYLDKYMGTPSQWKGFQKTEQTMSGRNINFLLSRADIWFGKRRQVRSQIINDDIC